LINKKKTKSEEHEDEAADDLHTLYEADIEKLQVEVKKMHPHIIGKRILI